MTPYAQALARARQKPDFIDLANHSYHAYEFIHPAEFLEPLWAEYLKHRCYQPQALGPFRTRTSLTNWYRARNCTAAPENFFLTPGTSDAYRLLFTLFCPLNKTIALPLPAYPLFEHIAALAERTVEFYHHAVDHNWKLDAESLDQLSEDVAILVLIEPNNPTGRIYNSAEVSQLRSWAEKRGVILIIDEVFEAFQFAPLLKYPRALDFPQNRCFTLNGLSKRWAAPDFKLAWGLVSGPSEGLAQAIDQLDTALDAFLPVSPFSCLLAEHLLQNPNQISEVVMRELVQNREILEKLFSPTNGILTTTLPEGGIHVLLQTPFRDDEALAVELLDKWSLHTMPGYLFGLEDQGFLCLSLLLPAPLFRKGVQRLAQALHQKLGQA